MVYYMYLICDMSNLLC